MDSAKLVLSFAHDQQLLLPRKKLIEHGGFVCESVSSLEEFLAKLCTTSPSLIILCHTLPTGECSQALSMVSSMGYKGALLVLVRRMPKCVPGQQHTFLSTSEGPAAFLQTVHRMLLA